MYGLPAALLIAGAIAAHGRRWPIVCACGVLLGNWLVNTLFVATFDDALPWLFFMAVDYLSGVVLLGISVARPQVAVVALYAAMLVTHAAFGMSDGGAAAAYRYWWALFFEAWAQLAICAGWLAYEVARDRLGAVGSASPPLADARSDRAR